MKLRFGQIEDVLQAVHGIPASGRTQFRAKIRNLIRVGVELPSQVQIEGAGRKANYHPADLFKLAFAVELLQSGIPPDPAATSVAQYWPDVAEGLFAARKDIQRNAAAARFLIAEPSSVTTKVHRFHPATADALAKRLSNPKQALLTSRLLIINVAALLLKIDRAARDVGLDLEAFNASLDADQAVILKQGARVYGNG